MAAELMTLAVAVGGALVIPFVGMRLLVPSLESSGRTVQNYRGEDVFLGLGIVWVFWVFGVTAFGLLQGLLGKGSPWLGLATGPTLVLCVFVFGLIDDAFGSSAEKGLRGHVRALVHGRLTTGGLKLIGIGGASLAAAAAAFIGGGAPESRTTAETVLFVIAGTVLIAGTSNLLNLLDLRPGRALKSYTLLVLLYVLIDLRPDLPVALGHRLVWGAASAIMALGPAVAVWRYDLGERGMLGDAGANPAGALVGFLLMTALPLWGVGTAAVIVVALNIASERVSFSRVIEGNRFLSWFDAIGRPSSASPVAGDSGAEIAPRNGENDG